MSPTKTDEIVMPPVPEGSELEHTVVDGKIERTEQLADSMQEPTTDLVEQIASAGPAPPPTTSGVAKWQPRSPSAESHNATPSVSVARSPATRPFAVASYAAHHVPTASRPAPAPLQGTPTSPRARTPVAEPPPFGTFDDLRPEALTFTNMFERDARTALGKLRYWLLVALDWLAPRARTGWRHIARFSVSTWQRIKDDK
jgi:hypothetical protein